MSTLDNGAVRMAGGSHLLGERLPAVFGTGAVYFRERRPAAVAPITDPADAGLERRHHRAGARRGVAAPRPHLARVRRQRHRRSHGAPAVVRFVADGTTWFGARRYEFNYTDAELGLTPGDPIGGDYFPVVPTAPST